MEETLDLSGIPEDERERFLTFREKVIGTNISENSLLATDYLNHFNEIVMLLEMIPDMPDIIEDAKEWAPKSYQDHFRDSSVADKELAVEAYDYVPTKFRKPFEETVEHMNRLVAQSIDHLEKTIASGDTELLKVKASACSQAVQKLMDFASAVIHGNSVTMAQGEIDDLLDVAGGLDGGFGESGGSPDPEPAPDPLSETDKGPEPAQKAGFTGLPNLGEAHSAKLMEVGIADLEVLRSVGAVEAYFRAKAHDPQGTTLNFLYALQAGLLEGEWSDLPAGA